MGHHDAPPLSLTLEQYAGVTAALAEGFALGAVLAQEQIDESVWEEARGGWAEAISESVSLQLELIEKRRIAEDCLGRSLKPLDEDPVAWTGLLGALATGERDAITASLGITMADVARLGRIWRAKMRVDPTVSETLTRVAPSAKPPSKVTAGRRELQPFPWTPRPRPSAAAEPLTSFDSCRDSGGDAAPREVKLASFQLEERGRHAAPMLPPALPESPPFVAPPAPVTMPSPVGQQTALSTEPAPDTPATPFETLDPAAHGVSLLRYAELVALLQEPRADTQAVLRTWGLDPEKRRAIEDYYNRRFAREARLATEFGRLLVAAQRSIAERRAAAMAPHRPSSGTGDLPAAPRDATPSLRSGGGAPEGFAGSTSRASSPPVASQRAVSSQRAVAEVPDLGVEQYAWVVATLQKTPSERLDAALDRLRLTPLSRAALDARWTARMAAEPGLDQTIAALVRRFLMAPSAEVTSSTGPTTRPVARSSSFSETDLPTDAPSQRTTTERGRLRDTAALWEVRGTAAIPFTPLTRRER